MSIFLNHLGSIVRTTNSIPLSGRRILLFTMPIFLLALMHISSVEAVKWYPEIRLWLKVRIGERYREELTPEPVSNKFS